MTSQEFCDYLTTCPLPTFPFNPVNHTKVGFTLESHGNTNMFINLGRIAHIIKKRSGGAYVGGNSDNLLYIGLHARQNWDSIKNDIEDDLEDAKRFEVVLKKVGIYSPFLKASWWADVIDFMKTNQKLMAIKTVKEHASVSLREAKNICDQYATDHRL